MKYISSLSLKFKQYKKFILTLNDVKHNIIHKIGICDCIIIILNLFWQIKWIY